MTFQAFREQFYPEDSLSIHQIYAWNQAFNRNNLEDISIGKNFNSLYGGD
jgi:hypothetical protein